MLNALQICLLLGVAVLGASAQLCFKQGSGHCHGRGPLGFLLQAWVWLGCILMVLNVLAFTWILREVPLTTAMPFAAAIYILVPLGSRFFFSELLLPMFWAGVGLICIGVVLATL